MDEGMKKTEMMKEGMMEEGMKKEGMMKEEMMEEGMKKEGMKIGKLSLLFCALPLVGLGGAVQAKEKLTYYCSAQEDWCQLMTKAFEAETGIDVAMTRKSSGETYAQVRAESKNPKGDIWWGGTGDPHLQAAEEGLTTEYISPMRSEVADWSLRDASGSKDRSIGIYSGALGYGYNTELMAKNGLLDEEC